MSPLSSVTLGEREGTRVSILDDQPLDQPYEHSAGTSPLSTPPSPASDHSRLIIPLLVIALLAGGFFGVRWWLARRQADAAQQLANTASAPPTTEPIDSRPPAITLPPMDQMDPFLRQLLGALSARPELARWLATDDVTRRIVFNIDQLARGTVAAKENQMIAPSGQFATVTRGGRRMVDANSYRRYDGLAATVASADATAVARAYTTIKPRLVEAYRQMGRPDDDFDRTLSLAIANLVDTPVSEQPPTLVPGQGLNWAYADRKLETLRPAQKQLLRMGPENQRIVQAKLREIDAAIKTEAGR
jgi:hypothetical protein